LVLALLLVAAAPAAARDTELFFSAREAAESEKGRAYLLDVPFYLKGESHAPLAKELLEMTSERSSSGAFRGDEASCESAFLSALKTLQERARESGADAIVDLVSVTRGQETESATDFRCVAGAVVVHVGLKGRLVELK
jgi:hypothetical protein